jgi:GAF domain-containing protein
MQRRGAVSPVKSRRRNTAKRKARKAARVHESVGDPKQQLDHLKRERDEAVDQQAATSEVLKVISRTSFDLKTVFETLVESASHLCRADKANISLLRGDSIQYVAAIGFSSEAYMLSLGLPVSRGSISGRCVLEGKTVHVNDLLADPEFTLHKAQKIEGFRTALGVPLLRDGIAIGAMFLSRPTVNPFTQKQIELVTTFADQAVIAIENSRLLNELRESLQQQTATAGNSIQCRLSALRRSQTRANLD